MWLSVIVRLLEESERCLPVVMIFLQQRKDLLDHLSNENSQQKAAGSSLLVAALKSNLLVPAAVVHSLSPFSLLFPQSPFVVFFSLYFISFLDSMYLRVCFLKMCPPTVPPSLHLCLFSNLSTCSSQCLNEKWSKLLSPLYCCLLIL